MLNKGDYNSFTNEFSDYLNTTNILNMKVFIFVGILQVFKVQDFRNFERVQLECLIRLDGKLQ